MDDVDLNLVLAIQESKRRFVNALREENADIALRAYRCTVEGLDQWKKEEAEHLRLEEERRRSLQGSNWKDEKTVLNGLNKLFRSARDRNVVHNKNKKTADQLTGSHNSDFHEDRQSIQGISQKSMPSVVLSDEMKEEEKEEITSFQPNFSHTELSSSFSKEKGLLESRLHPSSSFTLFGLDGSNGKDVLEQNNRLKPKRRNPNKKKCFQILQRNPHAKSQTFTQNYGSDASNTFDEIFPTSLEHQQYDKHAITTPLHEAARLGNLNLIQNLLSRGGDPNERDGLRRTALHLICGGLTRMEESCLTMENISINEDENEIDVKEKDIGIRLYIPQLYKDATKDKKKKGFSSLLQRFLKKKNKKTDKNFINLFKESHLQINLDDSRQSRRSYEKERMESLWALLTSSSKVPTINSVDDRGRTALHYAAELGREDMCSTLLGQDNVILTIIDENNRTPCELAGINGHKNLAAQLEARAIIGGGEDMMVLAGWSMLQEDDFGSGNLTHVGAIGGELVPPFSWFDTLENVEGVRTTMIDETKNKLDLALARLDGRFADENILDKKHDARSTHRLSKYESFTPNQISQLLGIFNWDQNLLVETFQKKPLEILDDAQILPTRKHLSSSQQNDEDHTCLICCEEFHAIHPDWLQLKYCDHSFCKDCLAKYIQTCASSRNVGILSVPCPHHECSVFLDISEIEELTGSTYNESYETLLEIENENFVSKASEYCFCPSPGCKGIVQRKVPRDIVKKHGEESIKHLGAVCTLCPRANDTIVRTYEGVLDSNYNSLLEMPKKAHRFCYTCKKKPHWPISCETLENWKKKVTQEVKDVETDKYEDVAQSLWIRANTRPCPKCQVPIEKNDGCNHMTCTNKSCKHEFCWICRQDWKLHNTKTGGFFRCNRWEEDEEETVSSDEENDFYEALRSEQNNPDISDEFRYGTSLYTARISRKKKRSMARFLHHYSRWSAHRESAELEQNMQKSVCERMAMVVHAASEYGELSRTGTLANGLSFIHAAFTELLECRSMLEHTYPFAFYRYAQISPILYRMRDPREIEKVNFELLQSELEMLTEQMSDIVARKHIRATMTQIMFLTTAAEEKRRELSMFMLAMGCMQKKGKTKGRSKKRTSPHEINNGSLMDLVMRPSRVQFNEGAEANFFRSQVMDDSQEDAAFQLAVQASIQSHIAQTDMEGDSSDDDDPHGWICRVCTYSNRGGTQCAICGITMMD